MPSICTRGLHSRQMLGAAIKTLGYGFWAAISITAIFYGGIDSNGIFIYPLLIVMLGWMTSMRAAVTVAVLTAAVTLALAIAQLWGYLPQAPESSPLMRWVVQGTVFAFSAMLVGYFLKSHRRDLQELEDVSEDLDRAQAVAHVGSWVYEPASGTFLLSAETCRIYNVPVGSISNTQLYASRVHPDDRARVEEAWLASLRSGTPYEDQHRIVSGETIRWVHLRAEPELSPDGSAPRCVGTVLDISERKLAEQRLVALNAELEERIAARTEALTQANRVKSDFMATITHELRTPLNSVIGFAELLKSEVSGPLNEEQAAFAADILASGQRLLGLVEGILEMSRLDKFTLEREPLDVVVALEERISAHRGAAQARRIAITLETGADLDAAQLDPRALRRILDALLDNAIKFNRDGGTIAVSARHTAGNLEIAVSDTGIGIPESEFQKLFQPLQQLDTGSSRHYEGIGLGLALARRLAQFMGGDISLKSTLGSGSTFTLSLPAAARS